MRFWWPTSVCMQGKYNRTCKGFLLPILYSAKCVELENMRHRYELEKLAQENGKRRQTRFPTMFYSLLMVILAVSWKVGAVNTGIEREL